MTAETKMFVRCLIGLFGLLLCGVAALVLWKLEVEFSIYVIATFAVVVVALLFTILPLLPKIGVDPALARKYGRGPLTGWHHNGFTHLDFWEDEEYLKHRNKGWDVDEEKDNSP